ncbi:MAG: [LysW]-aminoadipate kinase [Acidobacteria bacterium]|nr:[LysW]-aminoadipate kinase [Acidobacteriota bacterium]
MLVIKVGGAAGVDLDAVCNDLASLAAAGKRWILVHGGSAETNRVAKLLGHPPRFVTSVSGYTSRYTDAQTLEIFQMVYCGKINKGIVERLQKLGVDALGLSGMDGRLLRARRKGALKIREDGKTLVIRDDLSGRVEKVNTDLLNLLLQAGHFPVLCPPALGEDGQGLNVDGDRAAARIAAAMAADTLVILSDVPGLLCRFPEESSLVKELDVNQVEEAARDWAEGRMRMKLLGAAEAIRDGVRRVVLGDSRQDHPVRAALDGVGTTLRKH